VAKQTNSRRYLFQADATGVAGQIVHPFEDDIPVQAASSLTVGGGSGSSSVGRFEYKNILSFDSAQTEVWGREVADGVYETIAQSVVLNFKLLDFVQCDRIVGRLIGTHPVPGENSIVPTGSVFEGLRIGHRVFDKLELTREFFIAREHSTWSGLVSAVEHDGERRLLESLLLPVPNSDPVSLLIRGQRKNLLGFSIAAGVPPSFTVPDFGTVHLGEFFCEPTSRRLIMLRAELDGAVQGQVVVGDPIVDGRPFPPD
jgi:hypothetical protein